MLFKRKSEPDHEERLQTLERTVRQLQVEWLDTLDRFKSMLGRMAKDRARAEEARGETPTLPLDDSPASPLSTRQDQINAQILARRSRMRGAQ